VADFLSCQLFSNAFGGGSGDERRIPQSNQEPPHNKNTKTGGCRLKKNRARKRGLDSVSELLLRFAFASAWAEI
jgi:hypothetical protein